MDNNTEDKYLSIVEKRMKTVLIGSISRFEENFSYLWDEDSEDGRYFFSLWQKTREDVLDYGNYQIRSAKEDMNRLQNPGTIFKNRYQYNFDMRRQNENKEF